MIPAEHEHVQYPVQPGSPSNAAVHRPPLGDGETGEVLETTPAELIPDSGTDSGSGADSGPGGDGAGVQETLESRVDRLMQQGPAESGHEPAESAAQPPATGEAVGPDPGAPETPQKATGRGGKRQSPRK